MNDETLTVIAERYLGLANCEDYVKWAIACLEANMDSKNIRILASLRKPLYSSEVNEYFERSLAELGWAMPERRECLLQYARRQAERIVSRELPSGEGCWKIYRIAAALEYPHELSPWIYLDLALAGAEELHDSNCDDEIIREAERLLNS